MNEASVSLIPDKYNLMNHNSFKSTKVLLFIFVLAIFFHSCIQRFDRTNIEGFLTCFPKTYIYINRFENDSLYLIDSIKTNFKGQFRIKIKTDCPLFVTIGNTRIQTPIILLIQPGEDLTIRVTSSELSDYRVYGSNGSSLIRDLTLSLNKTKIRIDSLKNIYNSNLNNLKIDSIQHKLDSSYKLAISSHYSFTYRFIRDNPFSLASIVALFQAYDSQHPVLDYSRDRRLFRMADSSLQSVYSSNNIVKSFHFKIQKLDSLYEINHKRGLMFKEGEILPNIGYPLITGDNLFISGIWFRYILIDFWSEWCDLCNENSKHLKAINKEFGSKGLVILQVSLGVNTDSLKTRIVRDSLFWYHADIKDYYTSKLLDTLKISSIPANYITDRWGNIKAVNITDDKLKSKLFELLH